jgi:hypothetical protein
MVVRYDDLSPPPTAHKLAPAATFARAQKQSVLRTVLLTFFDTLSDYATYIVLANTESSFATPMLVVLLGSMVTQALVVRFITNEGLIAIAAAALARKWPAKMTKMRHVNTTRRCTKK